MAGLHDGLSWRACVTASRGGAAAGYGSRSPTHGDEFGDDDYADDYGDGDGDGDGDGGAAGLRGEGAAGQAVGCMWGQGGLVGILRGDVG